MKLVIDRETWVRGDSMNAALINNKGQRCCLGFYLRACGVPDEHMREIGDPETMLQRTSAKVPEQAQWLIAKASPLDLPKQNTACNELIHDNDGGFFKETVREKEIAKKFAAHGVEVVFVDRPETPQPKGNE